MNCFAKIRCLQVVVTMALFISAPGQNNVKHIFQEDSVWVKSVHAVQIMQYDSVKRLVDGAPDDTFKVKRLLYLFLHAIRRQDTAVLGLAKQLSEKLQYFAGLADSYSAMGDWYQAQSKFSTCIPYYLQAIAIDEAHQRYPQIFGHFAAVLNVFFLEGDFPSAMKITEQALSIAEKTGNVGKIASYNGLFGFIYLREGNFGVAKKYYTRYFNLSMQLKDSLALADAYCCLGDVYAGLRQQGNALSSFFKARHIYSNLGNFDSFQPPPGAETKQKERLAYTFNKISGAYFLNGNYVTALQYADSVFTYANATICNMYDLAAYYINTGNIYNHLKDYPAALLMLSNGAAISKKISHRENIRDAYAALAETYAGLRRYDSAYAFATLAEILKDSIVNEESIMKIAAVQSQYDNDKREQETAQHNLLRNLLIVSLMVGIVIVSLLYSRYLLKQKNKYQAQANKQQSELFNAVVSAQDKERKRIAQDIHDSLGSVLSAAKITLSSLEGEKDLLTDVQRGKYETVLALLDDASSELRNISHNLMPATLLTLGLVAALQNLFNKISATGMRIHFSAHDVKTRLDETMEISIYRIVLELVNNIVKHSDAEEATVQIIRYPSYLNITIEDNGRGFDYTQASAGTKGMGLGNILSRIDYLKGAMHVDSGKGTGTTVIIDIPLDGNTTGLV